MSDNISHWLWQTRYRQPGERGISDSWRRVARAMAQIERESGRWESAFYGILHGFRFLPGGRILAGAGSQRDITLLNCFVMGTLEDSLDGIFRALHDSALTMQMGGGVGLDFSPLRPAGIRTRRVGVIASGPVSFMHVWDAACATLVSSGNRRGAMMATLRCDHPDIEAFIDAKRQPGALGCFNLSVQITDDFMQAVQQDADWPLLFPADSLGDLVNNGGLIKRAWPGRDGEVNCRVVKVLKARWLWDQLLRASFDSAEPGVLFVDTINRMNNLRDIETITATNPCGEIPLPPWGGCCLGSLNLSRFISQPFSHAAKVDWSALERAVPVAVRLLDNVIDTSHYPLPQQQRQMRETRRIGLGITGLADALIMLGLPYGETAGREMAARLMQTVCHFSYAASVSLAQEKGAFPGLDCDAFLASAFIRSLPENIRQEIRRHGIRNSHLLAIAPTGTISLLAGNVSSGLEPVFAPHYSRKVRINGDRWQDFEVDDYACQLWREMGHEGRPPSLVTAEQLSPQQHLQMQASLQPFIDNAISKTINLPVDIGVDDYRRLYEQAWKLGLKGCTTFRPTALRGTILSEDECCAAEPGSCGEVD